MNKGSDSAVAYFLKNNNQNLNITCLRPEEKVINPHKDDIGI